MQSNRSLEGLFSSFSPDGNTYAIATSDGRLRLFDSGNGRLKVALGNKNSSSIFNSLASASVNENITSFSWIPSKEAACATASGLIVGTASGHVQLYDVQRGEIVWRTKDAKEGGVYAVSYSSGQNVILCSGRASSISIISAADGSLIRRVEASRYALTSLSLSSDHRFVLTGSSTFQLLQSDTFERVAKYTGHQNEVKTIRFVDGMDLFVSAGTGERDVAIWQAPPPAFLARNQCRAAVSLPLERPAVHVDAVGVPDAGTEEKEEEEMVDAATKEQMRRLNGQFFVSVVTETGVLYVWACRAEATASVAEKGAEKGAEADLKSKERGGRVKVTWALALKVSVQASSNSSSGEVIFASKLVLPGGSSSSNSLSSSSSSSSSPSSPTCTVLIARGTTAKPVFDTLAVPSYSSASSSSSAAEVVLAPIGGLLLGKGTTAVIGAATAVKADKSIQSLPRKAHDAATIVGVLNEGLPVLQRRMAAAGTEEVKGARRGTEASSDRKKRPLDRRPPSDDGEGAKEGGDEEEEEKEKEEEEETDKGKKKSVEEKAKEGKDQKGVAAAMKAGDIPAIGKGKGISAAAAAAAAALAATMGEEEAELPEGEVLLGELVAVTLDPSAGSKGLGGGHSGVVKGEGEGGDGEGDGEGDDDDISRKFARAKVEGERRGVSGSAAAAANEAILNSNDDDEQSNPIPLPLGSAKADSLAVLLTQAIRSNDAVLLEQCLASSGGHDAVIANSIARISSPDAAAFLKAATERLVARPAGAARLLPWLNAVVKFHTGYLMAAPGVRSVLAALAQTVERRLALRDPLAKAHGRLGLILGHSKEVSGPAAAAAVAAGGLPAPEVVFEDDDEAVEEDEEDEDEDEDEEMEDDEDEEEGEGMEGGGPEDFDSEELDSDILDLM